MCADSIGEKIYSGVGGQIDFMTGAALSEGGKPIIAMPSTVAKTGKSRIVPCLTKGGGVVTTRFVLLITCVQEKKRILKSIYPQMHFLFTLWM